MAQKNINFGNLVTPNGASLIFGEKSTEDANNLSIENAETWNPYNIIIDEENGEDIVTADTVVYDSNGELNSSTVQGAIDELEQLIHDTVENSTAVTIETWETAEAPTTSSELNQFTINKIKNQQIYAEMQNNNLINNNEIYLVEEITPAIFYAIYGETTFEEIKAAYDNQQAIACVYKNKRYSLSRIGSDYAEFDLPWHEDDDNILNSASSIFCNADSGTSTWTIGGVNLAAKINSPLQLISSQTELSDTTRYYRPILISTRAPTASDGKIGDIWIQYSEEE